MMDLLDSLSWQLADQQPWLLPLCLAMFGLCVGSYLNVVIYRLPRGLSTNEPRRSFCPHCKKDIVWYHNIPALSWIMLRGKGACCGQPIAARYIGVELFTAMLFAGFAWHFAGENILAQVCLCAWGALALAMFFMDWDEMIVIPSLALMAAAAGLGVCLLTPWRIDSMAVSAGEGVLLSLLGAASGFLLLKIVAWLGRLLFGKKGQNLPAGSSWHLSESADGQDIVLKIGEEELPWSELFMEANNRLMLQDASIQGEDCQPSCLIFSLDRVQLQNGKVLMLENHESLEGTCSGWIWRREAMGSGDAWLALSVGALCGWQGVLAALVFGSILGIMMAMVNRVGFGKPMPFGPPFLLAALLWLLWGNACWGYLDGCFEYLLS